MSKGFYGHLYGLAGRVALSTGGLQCRAQSQTFALNSLLFGALRLRKVDELEITGFN